MGGTGSGRHWHWSPRPTTDAFRRIDVRRWAREGLLEPGRSFGCQWTSEGEKVASINVESFAGHVRLQYRSREAGDEWEALDYQVRLLSQPCNLGGERRWFSCPARGCGRRVALLYGGRIFACRHCYGLAYPSQNQPAYLRHTNRANEIRRKLGWDNDEAEWMGRKPKGMHWRTFERLVDELNTRETGANDYFVDAIALLDRTLSKFSR